MIENPMIAEMERRNNEIENAPVCPLCETECETIYKDWDGNVIACDECLLSQDAAEWEAEQKEGREADEGDRRYHEMKDEGF